MLKQIINIWRNNNGSTLFVCGLLVVFFMSVLWRFDMIPDIGQSLRASPMMIGSRVTSMPTIVVVSITSDDYKSSDVQMQIFSAPEMVSESLAPLESRTTTMRDGLSEFLIMGLARGTYAGIAYVDVNSNGQIDLADDGSPAEPCGFAKASPHGETQALGVFEVSGDPTFVKIHLLKPKFPIAASGSTEESKK